MNTREINNYMKNDRLYLGTFSVDTLPAFSKRPATLIVNTDPSTDPGEHWVSIYLKDGNKGVYFDSYGLPPLNSEIKEYLNERCQKWKYNNVQLQPLDKESNTCGKYCIMFCKAMSEGVQFKHFINAFSKNLYSNDVLAHIFVE